MSLYESFAREIILQAKDLVGTISLDEWDALILDVIREAHASAREQLAHGINGTATLAEMVSIGIERVRLKGGDPQKTEGAGE